MTDYDNIPMIAQPKDLSINLYRHQLASVYKMERIEEDKKVISEHEEEETDFGFNANITGYGKTLEMVALVLRDKMQWNLDTSHIETKYYIQSCGRHIKKKYKSFYKLPTTLIVTNQSIIKQWMKEFSYTDLDVISIHKKKDALLVEPDIYDVIIITVTMYNTLINRFEEFAWKRFIFDEPGHVKIQGMKKIRAGFTWLITATPELVFNLHRSCRENMITDLFCKAYDGSNTFRNFIIKNSEEFNKQSFNMPETINKYYECFDPMFKTVRGLVSDKIAKMISAGNIKQAVKSLGGKNTCNVVELIKKGKTDEINILKRTIDICSLYQNQNGDEMIKKYEKQIEHIESQLNELQERFKTLLSGDCPICYTSITDPIMEPQCQNIFCGKCLFKWLEDHSSCPVCRQSIVASNLVYIKDIHKDDMLSDYEVDDERITKFKRIEKIIDNKKGGKFIIFSEYNQTFKLIREFLLDKHIIFSEIKGSIESRNSTIGKFKDGKIDVLFLNSLNNGSGINLQEATDIILYHEMEEDIINQILGRANRLGRKISLYVHHLVSV